MASAGGYELKVYKVTKDMLKVSKFLNYTHWMGEGLKSENRFLGRSSASYLYSVQMWIRSGLEWLGPVIAIFRDPTFVQSA